MSIYKGNFMLEKYFLENPWSDMTNLEELIKLTGLDDITIKVSFTLEIHSVTKLIEESCLSIKLIQMRKKMSKSSLARRLLYQN